MTQHDSVRAQLHAIEALLRQHQLWQETAPQPEAFASTQPFCLDTLAPFEWLQWVLIPRMHALLEGGHPLPQAFAVSPYYEMALEATHPARDVMLPELERLDALFAGVSSGLYVFSSIGGDRMALAAAAMLFAHYLNEYKAASASRDADPSLRSPVWVQASAGFKTIDKIQREQENNKRDPTLVVISNIVSSSSQNRKETVRDMLCLYDGSPRLVVTAPMSPMQIQSDLAIDVDGGIMFQSYQSRR